MIPESVIVVEGAVCLAGEEVSPSSDMVSEALGFLRLNRVVSVSEMSEVKVPVVSGNSDIVKVVSVSDISLDDHELRSEVTESSRQPRGLMHGL